MTQPVTYSQSALHADGLPTPNDTLSLPKGEPTLLSAPHTFGVRRCGWCHTFLGFVPELDGQPLNETTGCCDTCLTNLLAEIDALPTNDRALAGVPVEA